MEKAVSAADANRKFSKLLRIVSEGHSYVATSHGKGGRQDSAHGEEWCCNTRCPVCAFEEVASEAAVNIGRWSRDELYEDER
jgi:hypothetical protein